MLTADTTETTIEQIAGWRQGLDDVHRRIGPRFAAPGGARAGGALPGGAAEPGRAQERLAAGRGRSARPTPHGVQRLLDAASWDADAVRDDLRAYVVEHLGDPDGVLIVDETGFLKKGDQVGRRARAQYSGTAGRIENCQVGVFLAYASPRGRAFLDRALYLPEDVGRRRRAAARRPGVPDEVAFATKPELARAMLARAFDAGVPAAWVTGDEVYGGDGELRRWLEGERRPYVLAVARAHAVWRDWTAGRGSRRCCRSCPAAAWARLAVGGREQGAARLRLGAGAAAVRGGGRAGRSGCWCAARSATRGEVAYYRVFGAGGDAAGGAGAGGRQPLGDRGGLRAGQGRGGAGPLRGAALGRLAPARHALPAGARLPRRHPRRGERRRDAGVGGKGGRLTPSDPLTAPGGAPAAAGAGAPGRAAGLPSALVALAPPPPSAGPALPLRPPPPPRRSPENCGCSITAYPGSHNGGMLGP